jgi:cytochrome c biogenesis protein CcmG, thiol:disulfide interchange protein DsbE
MTTRTRAATAQSRKKFPIIPVVIGVAAIALVATVILTFEGDATQDDFGSPTVAGDSLLLYSSAAADPTLGLAAPEVEGADFEGNAVTIANDGRAKIVLFLAHWCPFCQNEVPIVQRWIDAGSLPDSVDLYAVSTSMDSLRTNYPPSKWLENEGWTSPVVVDDQATSVARAFGLNAFPYWVFIASDGTVWGRTSGQIPTTVLDDIARGLAES